MRPAQVYFLGAAFLAGLPAPAQRPAAEEQQHILATAREVALRYAGNLPNFICTESMLRTQTFGPRSNEVDKLTIELTYFNQREVYKGTAIDSKRTQKSLDSIGGPISGGEFGTLMLRVFEPSSAAEFEWKTWSSLRQRRVAVFKYRVPRARSHYLLGYRENDGTIVSAAAGYRGEVTLDAEVEPGSVLHLTAEADDIPKQTGILESHISVDYDSVEVAGRSYLLPLRADSSLLRNHHAVQNHVAFTNYRKFETASSIDFGKVAANRAAVVSPVEPHREGREETPATATAPAVVPEPHREEPKEREEPKREQPAPTAAVTPVPMEPRREEPATAAAVPAPTFRTDSQLVLTGFQVVTKKGQLIQDLKPEDIEILEDGVRQKVAIFEGSAGRSHSIPVQIALLFDCSLSVEVAGAMSPQVFRENLLDEFEDVTVAVYGFSDILVRATAPVRDAASLKKAADAVRMIPALNTPLFGAIADTARDFGAAGGPAIRMMALLSDGESFWHGDLERSGEAVNAAREHGIALYPVFLGKAGATQTRIGPSAPVVDGAAAESISAFLDLGEETGGRSLTGLMNTDVLPPVLRSLASGIRGLYVAGYYPELSGGAPKSHKVEVRLVSKRGRKMYWGFRTVVH